MKTQKANFSASTFSRFKALRAFTLAAALLALFAAQINAQTAATTEIKNQASAEYEDETSKNPDGTPQKYTSVSNTVTVTVAKVAGIAITPDAGTNPTVVAGQQNVAFKFTVSNTGNFAEKVLFLGNGNSIQLTSTSTLNAAVADAWLDSTKNGVFDTGELKIFGNSANVTSPDILVGTPLDVIVLVNVNNSAVGSTLKVQLGDAPTVSGSNDNQPTTVAAASANEVRTVSTDAANGLREASGDISATVINDAQLRLNLESPAGPLNAATATTPGSDILYEWELCNTGSVDAKSMTLVTAQGNVQGIFIIAPIPVGTVLKTFPTGTLFSIAPVDSADTNPSTAAGFTSVQPSLSAVRRIAYSVGSTLAKANGSNATCAAKVEVTVQITTLDATNNIFEIGDAFANNSVNVEITDQSGDTDSGKGDRNANFNEPLFGGTANNLQGMQQITLLTRTGSIVIGPFNAPAAVGPNSNNDDFTNRSVAPAVIAPTKVADGTTDDADVLIFRNTLRNDGNATDTFAVNIQSATGVTAQVSLTENGTYTNTVNVSNIAPGGTGTVFVKVTVPAGKNYLVDNFPVVVRATSSFTPTNGTAPFNETIDRVYIGFLRLTKTARTVATPPATPGDPNTAAVASTPGSYIEYSIKYENISLASGGGTGNSELVVKNLKITEKAEDPVPANAVNNWKLYTVHDAAYPAKDTNQSNQTGTGVIAYTETAASAEYTDTIATVNPGVFGTFTFYRKIK